LTFGSLAIVLALTGCAGRSWQFWKSPSSKGAPSAPAAVAADTTATTSTSSTVSTARPATTADTPDAATTDGFAEIPSLTDVRFRPGLVSVGRADTRTLDAVADWLKDNPGSLVRIEGHTDDLGTSVENLTVGERRATSAMKYLIARGLEPQRISVVSYGSDRPVCVEKTEACRARNRRVHFVVKQP
jgi:peptidoglycan-associated lipoprotein